ALADCGGAAISPRFTEAVQMCKPPASSDGGGMSYQPATVAEMPTSVSVSMPGYHMRLSRATSAVLSSARPTDALVVAVAQRYRIDPLLLAAIVHTESTGRVDAVSNKGALGLMQVMPETARGLGV